MQKDLEIRDPEYKSIIACINSFSSLTSAAATRFSSARFAAALAAAARSSSARFAAAEACDRKRKALQIKRQVDCYIVSFDMTDGYCVENDSVLVWSFLDASLGVSSYAVLTLSTDGLFFA